MKAGLISVAALSAVAFAQPHQRHRHAKKQAVEYVQTTEVTYVTATAPAAMVYVDANGNPVSTSVQGQAAEQTQQAPAYNAPPAYSAPAPEESPVEPAETSQAPPSPPPAYTEPAPSPSSKEPAPPAYTPPAPEPTSDKPSPPAYTAPASSSESAPKESSSPSSGKGSTSGHGISYSPYNSDNSCKTADQVNMDFEQLNGYGMVRIYGTDCDQAATVIPAAKSKGMKVFAGIYDIHAVDDSISALADAVDGDWSVIDTVSVGNEGVNAGTYTVGEVRSAVDSARSALQAQGYSGSVVTVDTFVAIIANPELCDVGDYVAANCHAFFDGGVTASEAGDFVLDQAQRVSAACGGKNTMISETGWPSQGSSNEKAVPSLDNQAAAVKSLKEKFSDNIILFTAFNDYWKDNTAATFNAEQYWGIYGNCPSEKK